jgi:hypothetical protein
MCCRFPSKKNPPVEAIFGMAVRCPINTFCTTATNDAARPQCLAPLLAETAGACGQTFVARPRCLVPSLDKTAGACCKMQLACNVSFPCWPRLLGLAVHKVSLPAMPKPLWCNCYLACCTQISSLPAMSRAFVGQDHWGLLCIRLARPRCQSPSG